MGSRGLEVTEDRPRVGVLSRVPGPRKPGESQRGGFGTLGWESGPGSALVLQLPGCVTMGKSHDLSEPPLSHLHSGDDYSHPACRTLGRK